MMARGSGHEESFGGGQSKVTKSITDIITSIIIQCLSPYRTYSSSEKNPEIGKGEKDNNNGRFNYTDEKGF